MYNINFKQINFLQLFLIFLFVKIRLNDFNLIYLIEFFI